MYVALVYTCVASKKWHTELLFIKPSLNTLQDTEQISLILM